MYKQDFPIFDTLLPNGKKLTYLDTSATAQKPRDVIETINTFLSSQNSSVHRSTHYLEANTTEMFENARKSIATFIGADEEEIIWTRGATDSLNIIAESFLNASLAHGVGASTWESDNLDIEKFVLKPGDEIVYSVAEHHSNIIPWQQLAKKTGATIRILPVDELGRIRTDYEALSCINERTKIVAVTHISNVVGCVTNVEPIVKRAHEIGREGKGAFFVLDACQSAPHFPTNVKRLDVDFLAFSGHKIYAPTGIGVLYGKAELLKDMPPVETGGSMVERVTLKDSTFRKPPWRFEAGTQAIVEIIGLKAAIDYMGRVTMQKALEHELSLTPALLSLGDIDGIRVLGPTHTNVNNAAGASGVAAGSGATTGGVGTKEINFLEREQAKMGIVSFVVDGVHPHDVGQYLDSFGIALRVGHQCAQPIHRHFEVPVSARASLGIYNTEEDIDLLIEKLKGVRKFFGAS
jgi:cysteine desulfurase/selenocysteine lyase